MNAHIVNIEICGIKIRVILEYPAHQSVLDKYRAFLYACNSSDDNDYDYSVELNYVFETRNTDENNLPAYNINNGIISIEKPDLSGTFDLEKKTGHFELFPNIHSFDSFLRVFFSVFLVVNSDGFLLHSSSVKIENKGYVFTGASGSGKSTIATLKDNISVLSDEIVAIRKVKGRYYTFGTPFMSKFVFGGLNDKAGIESIFFLHKSKNNYKKPMKAVTAIKKLLPNILFFGVDRELHSKLLHLVEDLVNNVKFYDLYFTKEQGKVYDIIEE